MRRFFVGFLVTLFLIPAQGCLVFSGHTTRVVKPVIRHHQYYDHVKDRRKKRTKRVLMKS